MRRTTWSSAFRCVSAAAVVAGLSQSATAQTLRGTVQQVAFTGPVTGRTVNFSIYLPEGYTSATERYPVIYHLHGIGGSYTGPHTTIVPGSFETAKTQGLIGPVIIVFPNGYTDAWWADSIDGVKPAETDVVQQLIPYVDGHYRTIASRGARVIEGFSMGGFGTTKFYSKYNDLFVACVEYDGAIVTWADMQAFHASLAASIFGNSEAYFNQFSPWYWTTTNAAALRTQNSVRMVAGALVSGNRRFRDFLVGLQIPVDYVETGCAHEIGCLFNAQGVNSAAFIAARLDLSGGACEADFDESGVVDPADIAAFVNAWLGSLNGGGLAGDFDGNGVVQPADIAGFVNTWLREIGNLC